MAASGGAVLSIDVGGTFTDLVLYNPASDRLFVEKTLSTPDAPEQGILRGVKAILREGGVRPTDIGHIIHASTVATNALLERKGARTAMITTRGHRDLIEIGRELRYDLYDLGITFPGPIVSRQNRHEVNERMLADGSVHVALDSEQVAQAADALVNAGAQSIAICFLNSYVNPGHEKAAAEAVRARHPSVEVSASAMVAPQIREYERFITTVIDAYVKPVVRQYLRRLEEAFHKEDFRGRLFIMLSNGGVSTAHTAGEFPVKMLESGPAAGALAAQQQSRVMKNPNIIGFDIGGTTAKISMIEQHQARLTQQIEVARVHRFKRGSGYPLQTSAIDLIEIGAGGGSIARKNAMGLLSVGPESAGAQPGPACYGLGGTEPTVTDAALALGYLDPDYFLGGKMKLDRAATDKAIGKLADELGIDSTAAAAGIYDTVNENMSAAMRMHLAEKGRDPRHFTLFAFGGAGPVHAFEIARKLGIKRIACPSGAGIAAAFGALIAKPAMDFVRSYQVGLQTVDWPRVAALYAEMEEEGRALMREAGVLPDDIEITRQVELRYVFQGYSLMIDLPADDFSPALAEKLADLFSNAHAKQYGRSYPDVQIESVNWRVWFASRRDAGMMGSSRIAARTDRPRGRTRKVFLPSQKKFSDVPVYDRSALAADQVFAGPAIVEERESTAVIGPDASFFADAQGNLIIEMKAGNDLA